MKKLVFGSLSVLVLVVFLCTSQTSCTKDTETVTKTDTITKKDTVYLCTPTIQGLWTGATKNTQGAGQDWIWSIRADGTATYENVVNGTRQFCTGTWTLTNGTWKCNTICVYGYVDFVGAAQTFTATYNATTGEFTNGTYTTTSKGTDAGTFTLTEVK